MSNNIWWLGDASTTEINVVARSNTDGNVVLSGDLSGSSTSASGTNDGIVKIVVTGLTAGTSYSCTLTFPNGDTEAVIAKTMPASGTFRIGFGSCFEAAPRNSAITAIQNRGHSAFFNLGDSPYMNSAKSIFGEIVIAPATDQSVSNLNSAHRSQRMNPDIRDLLHNASFKYVGDDHEWPADNWDQTIAQANSGAGGIGATLQSEVNTAQANVNTALLNYTIGNPVNSDAEASAQAPAWLGVADTNYSVLYFRNTIASCEFFTIDCITHRTPISNTHSSYTGTPITNADSQKSLLGSTQLAWLKKYLYDSTATFKAVMSPKRTGETSAADNDDMWKQYSYERDDLLAFMLNSTRSAADKTTYGTNDITGVIWLAGDRHTPQIDAQTITDGDTYDHLCVTGCPFGVPLNSDAPSTVFGYMTKAVFLSEHVFGELEVVGTDYMIARIVKFDETVLWSGRVYAGQNYVTYINEEVGI